MAEMAAERLQELEEYCALTEFAGEDKVENTLKRLYGAAVEYMTDAGVERCAGNAARYDLAVDSKVNQWYGAMRSESTTDAGLEPVGFRSLMSQLVLSALVAGVSNSDTPAGEG